MLKRSAAAGLTLALAVLAFVAGRYSGGPDPTGEQPARPVLYYVDPMHPAYRSDRPGVAPDCGMRLEPVYAEAEPGKGRATEPGTVFISSEKQGLIGVRVEAVRKDSGPRLVRTTGRVEVDGDRLYRLMAGAEGWVESVRNNPVGTFVKKDELLATLYSREFRNAQQAYLGSLVSLDRLRTGHTEDDPNRGSNTNLRNNEEQLRALGMGDAQIQELRRTRQITSEISVTAPADGVVLSRDISPGQRFEAGTQFYRIADLSKAWITADIGGEDAPMFRPGARVRVVVQERDATVYATVGKAPPFFDPVSRTLRLRLEADNPGFVLRPDMFVDLELPVRAEPVITVPVEALLDSGLSQRVFVERAPGAFEPRPVEIGRRLGDRVEILKGLEEGDRVVASGTFLVDSESRLRTSAR
ncbi:MAG: efflux RND transporter periplasmic adaptor subunit [Acidobacteria bacterium]|nr:efflux RND transporter periplasmic adaptor subunit [Acidobacteriota bacterium]